MAINITRTSGVTTEQVITDKKAKLLLVVPELATTGTLKLRNEGSSVITLAPTNILTVAADGGSLADDEYFVTVLGVDRNGDLSGEGTEDSATTATTNNTVDVTWDAMANAASYRVYVGIATGVYGGYWNVPVGEAFSVVDLTYDVAGDTPAGIPTSGNTNLKHSMAIGVPQTGKVFGEAQFYNGITFEQSVTTDICAIVWEPV